MLYILVCIVTILLLLPCVYSLPGFVYGRPASKLKFFRNMPPLWFWLLFAFGLAFYFAFFLTLLKSIAPLTARSVRLLIGCSIVFICAVFFVHGHAACAAFGKCGDGAYDLKRFAALLEAEEAPAANAANAAAREGKGKRPARGEDTAGAAGKGADKSGGQKGAESVHAAQGTKDEAEPVHAAPPPEGYDDELVADENYYAFANGGEDGKDEADGPAKAGEADAGTDAHDQSLFRFAGAEMLREDERACYYDTVRAELEGLFAKYPPETALEQSIPRSRWARVDFAAGKYYVVGVVRGETHPLYICYGVPAERRQSPPEPLKKYSSYVPVSLFAPDGKGYWMMFQDAETGRCIHLTQT